MPVKKYKIPKKVFVAAANVFEESALVGGRKKLREVGQEMVEEAREIIDSRRYKWKPLDKDYLQWKRSHGLSEKILEATGAYKDSFAVIEHSDGSIEVGVLDKVHEPSGLRMRVLARIHEFGTSTIPARPLWRPLMSKYKRKLGQTASELNEETVRRIQRAITGR